MKDHSLLEPLALALRARLSVIADQQLREEDPATHLKKLQEALETIEACSSALKTSLLHPQLRHYLERQSYDKALSWIEERL